MPGHKMGLKPIIWIASAKDDLISLPEDVKDEIGHALYQAQKGEKSDKAKPFKGFGGAAVLEVVEGIETPKQEIELIKQRFKLASQKYEEWLQRRGKQ